MRATARERRVIDIGALSLLERAELYAQLSRDEALRNKSYELLPLGEDIAAYLRAKKQRQSENTRKAHESSLDKLARHFADLKVEDFEPPVGTERVQEYLDTHWGDSAPSTYRLHLSVTRSFFGFWQIRGRLQGDPTRGIEGARKRQSERHTFTDDERRALIANAGLRDRIALRLMFDYGLRQGSLKAIRFKHFDHQRRKLTVFAKGGKVRSMPLPDPHLWLELERHILDVGAKNDDLFMCVERQIPRAGRRRFPENEMSRTTIHRWFYDRQADAGLSVRGEYGSGRERSMHAARHTAAQRALDVTGNILAVQKLLGHASISTTQEYVGLGDDELTRVLLLMLAAEEDS